MNIIRDEELGGILMIPLLVDWHIRRCNVKDCTARPNTIIGGADGIDRVFGLCEDHFQQGNAEGGTSYSLEWDNFDAFAPVAGAQKWAKERV